ncbi:hypothetical protein AB1285_19245 [Microbacterium sp. NRRL B-14842]|uniref:PucR family transcriptional regulator n=1 Tax=Microbacterium sp. NRRL B-14842 TaxID=3162881 RepID=UPI003D2CBC94
MTGDAPAEPLLDWWERRRVEHGTPAFLADSEDGVVICVSAADEALLDDAASRFSARVGVSAPEGYDAFSRAHAQALIALRQPGTSGAVRYADTVGSSLLTALATDEARLVAESRLAPLREHDAAHGTALEHALRTWLDHDTRAEQAAAALGIHRHTLRSGSPMPAPSSGPTSRPSPPGPRCGRCCRPPATDPAPSVPASPRVTCTTRATPARRIGPPGRARGPRSCSRNRGPSAVEVVGDHFESVCPSLDGGVAARGGDRGREDLGEHEEGDAGGVLQLFAEAHPGRGDDERQGGPRRSARRTRTR